MKLRELKGIGEKTEKLFQKIGLETTEDLLQYYPRTYDAYQEPVSIGEIGEGSLCAIRGTITSGIYLNQVRNLSVVSVTAADNSGKISLTWFNARYLKSILKKGSVFVFRGKAVRKKGTLVIEHPEIFTPAAYEEMVHRLQPVYGLTAGLTNKLITKTVKQVLDRKPLFQEYLPEEYREKYHLADYNFSVTSIHFPENMEMLLSARKRLVFDEFLFFILAVRRLKEKTEDTKNEFPMKEVWSTETVIENLPYTLTNAQKNVWYEIERDLKGRSLMSRLIQGDVGSGKTILAFLGMIMTAENGYQSALMVPTEVLAQQHYQALLHLIEENRLDFCRPLLLTGSNTAKEKRERHQAIESGEANLIIGTHALIQEKVHYKDLALVITDEQHRFGVRQRERLASMGAVPNILVMSATPIPRTLAIILYGDLDISVIDELPSRRLPIKNCVVDTSYRPKAYQFIQRQIQAGRQVYIICPLVEESEEMEAENVLDYTKNLKDIFPEEISIAYLHGKMKPKEKNQIMEKFASGQIQILVSTTVVEVGVNVPNATVMMIENAERFGLAQLHQLRGRVGRGEHQSYCIFIQGNKEEKTSRRLKILNESNDGFFIASEDLRLRGPGDFFGIRQSGEMNFRLADIYQDSEILKKASEAAAGILSLDPDLNLPQFALLRERLEIYQDMKLENPGL
ncbi:ATP-dependent DNA helicase RecG [Blautia sp. An249]|uniref:ATP-dependent DNA helicase RecG n=1 Tax=Blautia sp. An249 TaxID=1965603 RepID=UPI000B39A667|nr:ATP-dependent DNA helicase RecG [Blautia sp. An249]OUO80272.1 ATP-dependent DNA helicase RecG [Blautia sp. An249]